MLLLLVPVLRCAVWHGPFIHKRQILRHRYRVLPDPERQQVHFAELLVSIKERRALAEMDVVQASIAARFPEKMHLRATMTPLQEEVTGTARKGLVILFAAVGAVLLIVCVNLANLSLARAAGRGRDLAIRTALGAGRAQLVRYILGESLAVGLAGGAACVALAWAGLRAVLLYAPLDLPRLDEIHLDARALLFALALCRCSSRDWISGSANGP
jgi:hypothetical protein